SGSEGLSLQRGNPRGTSPYSPIRSHQHAHFASPPNTVIPARCRAQRQRRAEANSPWIYRRFGKSFFSMGARATARRASPATFLIPRLLDPVTGPGALPMAGAGASPGESDSPLLAFFFSSRFSFAALVLQRFSASH